MPPVRQTSRTPTRRAILIMYTPTPGAYGTVADSPSSASTTLCCGRTHQPYIASESRNQLVGCMLRCRAIPDTTDRRPVQRVSQKYCADYVLRKYPAAVCTRVSARHSAGLSVLSADGVQCVGYLQSADCLYLAAGDQRRYSIPRRRPVHWQPTCKYCRNR